MASLLITAGNNAGAYFQLAGRPLSIGRDPARDIQLTDPKVSRKHCIVRRVNENYILKPFPSVNAVLVNGTAITDDVMLNDRDKIEIGDSTLRFRANDDPNRTDALERRKLADRRMRADQTIQVEQYQRS